LPDSFGGDSIRHLVKNADTPLTPEKLGLFPSCDWIDYFLIGNRQMKMGHFRDALWCFTNAERLYNGRLRIGLRMIWDKKVNCIRQIDLYVKTQAIALDSNLDPGKLTVKLKCNRPEFSKKTRVICNLQTKLNPGKRVVKQELPTKIIDRRDIYCRAIQSMILRDVSDEEILEKIKKLLRADTKLVKESLQPEDLLDYANENEKYENIIETLNRLINPRQSQKEPIDGQKQAHKKRKVITKNRPKKKSRRKTSVSKPKNMKDIYKLANEVLIPGSFSIKKGRSKHPHLKANMGNGETKKIKLSNAHSKGSIFLFDRLKMAILSIGRVQQDNLKKSNDKK